MIIEFGLLNYKLLLPLLNPILYQTKRFIFPTETSLPLYDYFIFSLILLLAGPV